MIEKDFQSEITYSFHKYFPKSHYYKIADPMADKLGSIRTIKRPYDLFFLCDGDFFAIELKFMKTCESFNFNKLEKHQQSNLKQVSNNGQHAYIIINYRFKPNFKQIKKYSLLNKEYNFTFAIDINNWLLLKNELLISGNKSIPITIILEAYKNKKEWEMFNFIELVKIKNRIVWKVNDFIKQNKYE